jgi:hypothetical protein
MRENEKPLSRSQECRFGRLVCQDHGQWGCVVMVVDERDPDETTSQPLTHAESEALACWLTGGERVKPLPAPAANITFGQRLKAACPVRGDIPRLCRALNLTDMSVRHWLWGDSLPPPQIARRIAVYLGWDPERTADEIEAECAERAIVTIRRRYQGNVTAQGVGEPRRGCQGPP